MRVFDESLIQIVRYEWNIRNPRFGLPVMYRITLNDPREQHSGIGLPLATVFVHWSRVIHLADNLQSSEIFGVPRMRPILYPLLDVRKVRGGSAEGYWKGCVPMLSLETHPELGGDPEIRLEDMKDALEQMMNGLQRYGVFSGMALKTVPPAALDPTPYLAAQLEAICIQLECPVRVFKGAERGELASSQDDEDWNGRVHGRRVNYVTPRVIVPFIDRLIQLGILPMPQKEEDDDSKANGDGADTGSSIAGNRLRVYTRNRTRKVWVYNADSGQMEQKDRSKISIVIKTKAGYCIEWPDPEALGAKDKAGILLQRTQAWAAYAQGGLESTIPPKVYATQFDSMEDEAAEEMLDQARQSHEDEDTMTIPPMVSGRPAEAPPGTQDHADSEAQKEQAKQMADAKAQAGGSDIEASSDAKADSEPPTSPGE
jgi:hypothetical protein